MIKFFSFSKKKCVFLRFFHPLHRLNIDIFPCLCYNSDMGIYQHIKNFDIRYCDVDFKDELKPSAVLAFLEEAACSSADELGFGYQFVRPRSLAFMVTNVCCEFVRPIMLWDKVHICTWPLPPTFVVFGREYQMYAGEELLMNASSRWCLIDMANGKIAQSKRIDNQDYSTYNTSRALAVEKWKIPVFPLEEGEMKFALTIANSEYDHNLHVNNTRYADYCFNCFSIEELKKKRLKKFSIAYVRQCFEGDVLRFYRKDEGAQTTVLGVNMRNELVVQAEMLFE